MTEFHSSSEHPHAVPDAADVLAIADRLRPILLRLHRYLRYEAHEVGVTTIQASLLGAMSRAPGIGLTELAAQEHMSAPTLVTHIDKLEAAGFVERTRSNPQDRRRVGLSVTEAGRQIIQTLRERRTAWLATRLEMLTPDELAVVAQAIEPLQRLARSGS
ncbi:MAG TPA: MarR family transcriptional regulator [Dictyobacter sp.]|jgi:DNA-binding MarR family transcriptional regulator|nr:MarR family transcriptional regulator [Dictyobacter sp.]